MSYFGSKDFLVEVSKGNVPGHSLVHKFGRNDAVPNGSWEIISNLSAAKVFLTAATTMRIKAGGNAADTAAGAGAREVTLQGLNNSLARDSEAVATAGASASANTTTSLWRIDRAFVSAAGTYATPVNTGNIVIEDSAGTQDLIQINAGESQTQYCGYAIPTGVTAHLLSVDITVDSLQAADVRLLTRENLNDTAAPLSAARLRHYWDGLAAGNAYRPDSPDLTLAGPADIWMEAQGSGGGTEVTASFELLLVDS